MKQKVRLEPKSLITSEHLYESASLKLFRKTQGAFVLGRQILDAALIAHECINSIFGERKSGLVCKLDIEKAYDHVDLEFLDYTLGRMGCGNKCRGWIRVCVHLASFSILVNDSPNCHFKALCGPRLGDPLLLYLFAVVVEALSMMLKKCVENGLFSGFSRRTFQINVAKSEMLGVHVDHENLSWMAIAFDCQTGSFSTTYLGLSLCLAWWWWREAAESYLVASYHGSLMGYLGI
ncbi:uncharacterized protein LOC131238988 [Magnolia sinica]|uniref:uncharacterized protein LOC131238988 n=1 Tax=Magnolia sinica TaxID=86752 RepID=UPI00265B5720|nr:uncharacterized protein LOC131238988 [Magnolia sinica]